MHVYTDKADLLQTILEKSKIIMTTTIQPLLIVHGGAGNIPDSRIPGKFEGVQKAAKEGYKVLNETGSVIDAVVAAVKVMEDLESFNAGKI